MLILLRSCGSDRLGRAPTTAIKCLNQMPKSHTIRLGSGDLVHPVDARQVARSAFMKVVCELEPGVMGQFFSEVYQSTVFIEKIWGHLDTPDLDFKSLLAEPIEGWARRVGLALPDACPPNWVYDEAIRTVIAWAAFREISPRDPMPNKDILLWESGMDYHNPETDPPIAPTYPMRFPEFTWNPLAEPKRVVFERILGAVKIELRRHLAQVEKTAGQQYLKSHQKDSLRHYEWLVRRLVKRESVQAIAFEPGKFARRRGGMTGNECKAVEETAVNKALRSLAKLLELNLPTKH